jgi:hypothetical protein
MTSLPIMLAARPGMFRQVLFTQWKWSRLFLLLLTVAGFAIPALSVQANGEAYSNYDVVLRLQAFGIAYPILAAAVGVLLSLTAWSSDHRGRHVYALSLPIERWRYVWLRYVAGLLLIVPPVIAIWIGGELSTRLGSLPVGLNAYAGSLALRFALAAVLSYTALFAISAGTPRMAGIVLGIGAAIVAIHVLLGAAGLEIDLLGPIVNGLFIWPGPFEIFTGRWMLIDV